MRRHLIFQDVGTGRQADLRRQRRPGFAFKSCVTDVDDVRSWESHPELFKHVQSIAIPIKSAGNRVSGSIDRAGLLIPAEEPTVQAP